MWAWVLLATLVIVSGCASEPRADAPRLPDGRAGEILARAIDAAGGWQRWRELRDVTFVTTFTVFDPVGNVSSESLGLHKSPLHDGPRVRLESLGLAEPVTLGFDGRDAWMLRGGKAVPNPGPLALPRFNMIGNVFWFSLPFSLAETPATITALDEVGEGDATRQRLKMELRADSPEAPGDWFVLYIDPQTGLIDRVLGHIVAPFLAHELWVGQWLEYQDWAGIKKERRRQFFPADATGRIVGNLVAEQLVEDVRFNQGYPPEYFDQPLAARGGHPL